MVKQCPCTVSLSYPNVSHSVCDAIGLESARADLMLVVCFVLLNRIRGRLTGPALRRQCIQAISNTVDNIKLQDQKYQRQVSDVQTLIGDVRRKLEEARFNIKQAVSSTIVFYSVVFYFCH
jgi:hypothetical protein